jgi:hypothetical protein
MIAAFFLAAAPIPSAIDAELAFARDAQRMGQWTAFRKWADRDAVVFTPQAAWAQRALPQNNPRKAISWRPAHSFVSCDGRTAVNTGPWWNVDGKAGGYFTTVWQRSGRIWRWVYDGGGPLEGAAADTRRPQTHRASCRARAPGAPVIPPPVLTEKQARKTPEDTGRGQSADKTLGWDWKVDKQGGRALRVFLWTGSHYAQVLHNQIPPPKKQP